jgi:hypothetical protein
MSVSSVSSSSAPLPFNYLDTNAQNATPAAAASDNSSSNGASDTNDAGAAQPPAPPPLPPGQGQRVNQLV